MTGPSEASAVVQRPQSLSRAVMLCGVLVALGLVVVVLTVVLRDELIRSWAQGRPDERRLLDSGGLDAVRDGTVKPPAFGPVAIVLFVVLAGLIWVLLAFLRNGYGWARLALTVLLVLLALGSLSGLRTGPPAVFVALCLVSLAVELAVVVQLWRPDTSAFLRGDLVAST